MSVCALRSRLRTAWVAARCLTMNLQPGRARFSSFLSSRVLQSFPCECVYSHTPTHVHNIYMYTHLQRDNSPLNPSLEPPMVLPLQFGLVHPTYRSGSHDTHAYGYLRQLFVIPLRLSVVDFTDCRP
ncbi:hypothetical protein GGS23DRAFT_522119 [Durotheca rogersii]|uniref:uncharacterized protein n=1 Tax=Durotheca rogersii TaxID=419775 RepID=UPI0022207B9C|nr:uncharacterized protein GGS23DRAFT_522119 [Durotheca rogersii]KAI5863944.1 hypothetical protein GGS23DRAFT_522119 [Durotheca rogersii]